jgi:CRISPR-associated protein Csx14
VKRILLAVCGISPQVITETLYALHQQGRMVDAVRILTTSEGKDRCLSQLFRGGDGALYQLLDEYGISRESVEFSVQSVRAINDSDGNELKDITNENDNELFLRACMEEAFTLTQDPDTSVYFSLSGGRKTMSACLATAVQFYGRPQDRLFHVLASPEFERSQEFYFPRNPPKEIVLKDSAGKDYRKSTKHAQISLISMPFVSIREHISSAHLVQPESPANLLSSLVREPKPILAIDLRQGKIRWKGLECDIPPIYLAVYSFFASLKAEANCTSLSCHGCTNCFLTLVEIMEQKVRIGELYQRIGTKKHFEIAVEGINSLSESNFNTYKTRLHNSLERSLGAIDLPLLEIIGHGRPKRHGIALEKQQIRIEY